MNFKNLFILFLICAILLIGVNVIAAGDNNTSLIKEDNNVLNETKISQNTSVKQSVSKIKTSVSTPDLGFVYKKNSFMKITIKDNSTKIPVKNLKIKVKVYLNRYGKYKIYTLKTDKKGIAKMPTKNLKLGYHKFIVNTTGSKYKVYKKAYCFVGYKKSVSLKINKYKKLKNGDSLKIFAQNSTKGVYTRLWYAGVKSDINPHYTMILNAKLFFKNSKNGKIISKTIKGTLLMSNGGVYKKLPYYNLTKSYVPIKAKIYYLTSK